MKNVILSDRLNAVAGLVKSSDCVCDIGTDHGFVPIYLINSGVCHHALAMDINEGPLERAREHIRENGLEDVIETRLSNGMEELHPGDADAVICAGMGGLLMKRILEDGNPREKGIRQMVLQPQSDLRLFREFLRREKYYILDEAEIFEEGKYYVAILVSLDEKEENTAYNKVAAELKNNCDEETAIRICDRFGPCLIIKRDDTLKRYLEREKSICEGILLKLSEDEHAQRRHDIISKMNDISTVLDLYNF
ncbi:class I SAM-dependent methyltransferase [Butyrivibrio sp. AE3004]|uniref:class I SAM-dependent methyltransferase n=1 Tax=Butyrivibrio sp. AE3004 TaxID=1506994 RepID=UPI00068DBEA4|nr:class I SAM-dependent methyltransferase [Butyrivibrio sp. AE3004]